MGKDVTSRFSSQGEKAKQQEYWHHVERREVERETETENDRQTDRQAERQTERERRRD